MNDKCIHFSACKNLAGILKIRFNKHYCEQCPERITNAFIIIPPWRRGDKLFAIIDNKVCDVKITALNIFATETGKREDRAHYNISVCYKKEDIYIQVSYDPLYEGYRQKWEGMIMAPICRRWEKVEIYSTYTAADLALRRRKYCQE